MKKTLLTKTMLLLLCLVVRGVNSAWADNTSTLTFTSACSGSGTADDGVEWTVASDGTESTFDNTKGIHYGTGKAEVQYITLSTSEISGTITKVVVNASAASGVSATASVTVGGSAFGGDAQSLTTSAADYTFEGSASGEIVVTVTKPSKATKAIYVKSVTVTYTTTSASPLASIAVDASGATTVFHVGDEFTHEGAIVTATYEDKTDDVVTDKAVFSTPDMSSAGTKTVTVSYTENKVEKTTTYDITVNAPATLSTISLSGTYPTEFTQGDTFSSEGIVVTGNYDDETTKDVTAEATFSGYDMSTTGNQTVTVSYGGKTTTYDITVNAYVQPTEVSVDMNYQWLGSSNGSNLSSSALPVEKVEDNVTITITDGSSTRPRGDADYIRVYNGSTIKFEAPTGYNITKIVFTTGGSGTWNAPTASVGTLSSKTWTGEATEVTFTLSGTCFIASAAITLETIKVLSSIALSGTYPTTFHTGDTFSHEGMTVTANYEGGKTKDVTESATFTGYDMASTGVQTVTVSYTENAVEKTATYDITVNAPATLTGITLSGTYPTEFERGDDFSSEGIIVTANYDDETSSNVTSDATFTGYDMSTVGNQTVTVSYSGKTATYDITVAEKKGSAARPYTVAEAVQAIDDADKGTVSSVYVKGIISQIDSYNSTYSSITYWISADGTTTDQFEVYSGKGIAGADFSSTADLKVGDEVVITGNITYYAKGSVYEFASSNQLVSLNRMTISSALYATYASEYAHDFTASGVTAYTAQYDAVNGKVVLTEVTEVPANTAVILHAETEGDYTATVIASADALENNDLLVSDGTVTGGNDIYALANKNSKVGFYNVSSEVTIPAGKAYLNAAGAGARAFIGFAADEETTGITSLTPVPSPKGEGSVYTLDGRRYNSEFKISNYKKGLYIVNGKKMVIK